MKTVFSNIALADVPSVQATVSESSGSELASKTSGQSTASAKNPARATAINDVDALKSVKSSGDILPKNIKMDSARDVGVLGSVSDTQVAEIDVQSLIHEQCFLKESDLEGGNVSGANEAPVDPKKICKGNEDFFSCGGVSKVPVKGGGYVKSKTIDNLTSMVVSGVNSFVNGTAASVSNAAKEAREIGCALKAGMSLNNTETLDIASATPAGRAAMSKLSQTAAEKGNTSYLAKMNDYLPSKQIEQVSNENTRSIFNNSLSNVTPSRVGALDNVMPNWAGNLKPGDLDYVNTTNHVTEDQERAMKTSQQVNHSDEVTA